MSDVLERICEDKRAEILERKEAASLADLKAQLSGASPPRGFERALREGASEKGYALICEIKKASP